MNDEFYQLNYYSPKCQMNLARKTRLCLTNSVAELKVEYKTLQVLSSDQTKREIQEKQLKSLSVYLSQSFH
jgi:hypothetical protein